MEQLNRNRLTQDSQASTLPEAQPGNPPAAGDDSRNVLVSHGIHTGHFPVGGMTVRDARNVLRRLINIEDEAVAVINGAPVEEDTIIEQDVSMLSFVKPASIRG